MAALKALHGHCLDCWVTGMPTKDPPIYLVEPQRLLRPPRVHATRVIRALRGLRGTTGSIDPGGLIGALTWIIPGPWASRWSFMRPARPPPLGRTPLRPPEAPVGVRPPEPHRASEALGGPLSILIKDSPSLSEGPLRSLRNPTGDLHFHWMVHWFTHGGPRGPYLCTPYMR